jgi:peptidoglycan/xylan/chitin deacetylase (PgdA/CDA1 family)
VNLASFSWKSKGPSVFVKRIPLVFQRFGFREKKIASYLNKIVSVCERHNVSPTLTITAVVLNRHPELVQALQERGVEFAIHGLVHTDYSQLPLQTQIKHLKESTELFERNKVYFQGFRLPYLRFNKLTLEAVNHIGFKWESSEVVNWEVLEKSQFTSRQWRAYQKVLKLYRAKNTSLYPSLPRLLGKVVEIPVSLPDDEMIVDRLGITETGAITSIWTKVLEASYERGELFVIQLHHERAPFLIKPLGEVLSCAKELKPGVWIGKLSEIADWFLERKKFRFYVVPRENGRYFVSAHCSERATILVKNAEVSSQVKNWNGSYKEVVSKDFELLSPRKPFIGVSVDSSNELVDFLVEEGFIVEKSQKRNDYGIFLDGYRKFDEQHKLKLIRFIESSDAPILRFWRWPQSNRSALAVTGDIDAITIFDFFRRLFEF